MQIIDEKKYFEQKDEIIRFIINNEARYHSLADYFIFLLLSDVMLEDQENIPTAITEIFSKFDVIKEKADKYKVFHKMLQQYSFLDGNCMEVAAGIYPRLAELVAKEIENNHHTLTLCDPDIEFKTAESPIILKEKFTKKTDISNIDTLFAMSPCESTIPIAEKAFEEDKNLLLAFCSCDHSTSQYQKWIGKYWAEDVCMIFREKYGAEAQILNWPSTIGSPLPILVRESSKQKVKK